MSADCLEQQTNEVHYCPIRPSRCVEEEASTVTIVDNRAKRAARLKGVATFAVGVAAGMLILSPPAQRGVAYVENRLLLIREKNEHFRDSNVIEAETRRDPSGNIMSGPISKVQLPLQWSFSENKGGFTWGPVTARPGITETRDASWNEPIAAGYHISLFWRSAVVVHTVTEDTDGATGAAPTAPRIIRRYRVALEPYPIWMGPFPNSAGF